VKKTDRTLFVISQRPGEVNARFFSRNSDFAEALETLFARRVDLLTERMIGNPYFRLRATPYSPSSSASSASMVGRLPLSDSGNACVN